MIRAIEVKPKHRWTEAPADTVVLDFDDRHRRRMAMTGTRGLAFLLDLENAIALRGRVFLLNGHGCPVSCSIWISLSIGHMLAHPIMKQDY